MEEIRKIGEREIDINIKHKHTHKINKFTRNKKFPFGIGFFHYVSPLVVYPGTRYFLLINRKEHFLISDTFTFYFGYP